MDSESISRILILTIVANLGIMIVVIVPVLRRWRNRESGRSTVAYAALQSGAVSSTVLADRLASIAGPRSDGIADSSAGPDAASLADGTDPDMHLSTGVELTEMPADQTDDTEAVPALDVIQSVRARRFTLPAADDRAAEAIEAFLSGSGEPERKLVDRRSVDDRREDASAGLIDPETTLDSPLEWSRVVDFEQARSARYGRPTTVVIVELDGLDIFADRFGKQAADRLIPPVADALRRNARSSDRVARLGRARFGVLLVETDEVRAVNYVERVRAACDRWLEASALALRLSIGWASPMVDGELGAALRVAEDRMHREQRRAAPWRPEVSRAEASEA